MSDKKKDNKKVEKKLKKKKSKPKKKFGLSFFIKLFLFFGVLGILSAGGLAIYLVRHYGKDLPDYTQLAEYKPLTVSRLYASDGNLLAEYAHEKRLFVPIEAIPKQLINAFISSEDKNFYSHSGIDFVSIIRAAITNFNNIGKNKPLVGGSTITQQVVKNFLLTNEQSIERKVKEAILAFRISQAFPKDRILELYLNEIYLGARSYGVAAASLNYFNKSIDELQIEEAALLAGLPKAPSSYDPRRYPDKALKRRNYVLDRMYDNGYINSRQYEAALNIPIILKDRRQAEITNADYFAEAVRRQMVEKYGENKLYREGLSIHTTLVPEFQEYAHDALRKGLRNYDRRHGWKGVLTKIETKNDIEGSFESLWLTKLKKVKKPDNIGDLDIAVVLSVADDKVFIGLEDGATGTIPLSNLKWARKWINDNTRGESIEKASDVLSKGDVILTYYIENSGNYTLEQIPEINGAIVAIDPHNGRVLSMVGGYDHSSSFNRAIQAKRQPGSAFKPFVYLAALVKNTFTPASIIVDAEIEFEIAEDTIWSPKNYSGKYYGPSTLRQGVERSRNAMTVRLAQIIGLQAVADVARKFGIYYNPDYNYSFALGAKETSVIDLVNAYAILVNGGKKVQPTLVEYIQNSSGNVIYKRDKRECDSCYVQGNSAEMVNSVSLSPPSMVDNREQVVDSSSAYQIVSILEGVVKRGTGMKAKSIGKTLGGKTGTTNDSFDSWFIGFSPDLVVGVYAGFDTPRSMGKKETGASVALPIFIDFMKKALKDKQDIPFRVPKDINLVRIDKNSGKLPSPATRKKDIITEAFKIGTAPNSNDNYDKELGASNQVSPSLGTGGIY